MGQCCSKVCSRESRRETISTPLPTRGNEENKQVKKSRRSQKLEEEPDSPSDNEASATDEEVQESSKASVTSSSTETGDRPVDKYILNLVKSEIGRKWQDLGRGLEIKDAKLDSIDDQYKGLEEKAYRMLCAWREANGTKATVAVLIAELEAIEKRDLATEIKNYCSNNPSKKAETPMKIAPKKKEEHLLDESEWLKQLRSKLHDKHRKFVMKGLPWLGNVVVTLADYYVDLIVKTDDGNKKATSVNNMKNPSNMATGYSFAGKVLRQFNTLFGPNTDEIFADSSKEEEVQHMVEIFQSAFSSKKRPLRVLVEGPPGFGKTTLSAKLCFDYATPEVYVNNFDLVLHFSLRNFEGNLEKMLYRAADLADSHNPERFLKIIENPSNRILLVLDGYDEVPQLHVKPILALLQGQRFPHVAVVVTSRPGHFTFERLENENDGCGEQRDLTVDWNGMWQSRITILGFNKEMKELFIEKHLAGFPENIRSEVSSQLQQLEKNKIIQSEFLECPLFLLMIILLATDETGGIRNLITPTDLYKNVFNFIIRRYCAKQNEPVNEQVDLFGATESPKPFYIDLLSQFGEFALWALTNGKLSFSEDEVLGCQRNRKILDMGLLTRSVFSVGFREKVVYEPVHKSLLEFSAAYALWLQFPPESERGSWAEKVICLWRGNKYEPFFLIVLAKLMMRHRIFPALLDVFKPYSMGGIWERWLRHSVSETEVTESVLSSLTTFLPTHWGHADERSFSRTQRDALLLHGIREGRIKRVRLSGFLATPMPDDVVVDTALFRDIEDTVVNLHKFNCRRLVFWDSHISRGLDTWIPSTINFQTLSFLFWKGASSELGLLRSALTAGALKDVQIQLTCKIGETAAVVALTELIKMEKLKALDLSYAPNGPEFNDLLRAAANSSQLTTLLLLGGSVDVCHLCVGVQKTWQFLSITYCHIEFPPQTDQTLQAKCLVLDWPNIPAAVLRCLEVCQVTSLQCRPSLLADMETLTLLPQHLTELNVLLDKTVMDPQQCRLPHLPNLTVLILTMTDDGPDSLAVRDFLFGSRSFLRLKGIEIWQARWNKKLSVEFMKCVSDCLEQSIPVPTCEGTLRSSHSLQLEYFLMHCRYESIFLDPLGGMKDHLRNKALSRLDIVTERPCSPDLLDMFSPIQGFRVETDLWGTRSDDPILRRMICETQPVSLLSLFVGYCNSVRHSEN